MKVETDSKQPAFICMPKHGYTCKLTGLSRPELLEMTVPCERNNNLPPVHSVVFNNRGRSIRLINTNSLLRYLYFLATGDQLY